MSETTLSLPDIPDSKVVLDEREARDVLAFFWPSKKPALQKTPMILNLRRYAQALLIVGIDGSYAMGFLHIAYNVVFRRKLGTPINKLIRKVARKSAKHWWEHASGEDLEEAQIYETVRKSIARNQKTEFERKLNGIALVIPIRKQIVLDNVQPSEEVWI